MGPGSSFSIKKFYELMFQQASRCNCALVVWQRMALPNRRFIVCVAIQQKLPKMIGFTEME